MKLGHPSPRTGKARRPLAVTVPARASGHGAAAKTGEVAGAQAVGTTLASADTKPGPAAPLGFTVAAQSRA